MIHKIIRCKKCGRHYVSLAKKHFICRYCNTSATLKKKNEFGLNINIVFLTEKGLEAAIKCAELNAGENVKTTKN